MENVLIGVFPVDSWPFQLSVGKNPSVSFLEASNLQDLLKSGVWGMSLGCLLGISLIPNAVRPFLMVLSIIWVSFPFISVGIWLLGDESTLTGLGVLGLGCDFFAVVCFT